MMRFICLTAMLSCAVSQATAADGKIVYNPKYSDGDKSTIEIENHLKQTLTIAGMNLDTDVERFMTMKQVTGKKTSDGLWPVTSHFEIMQTNMKLPGGVELSFDSGNPDKKSEIPQLNSVLDLLRAISKSKFVSKVDKEHKIKSMEYVGNPLEGLDESLKKEADLKQYKDAAKIQLARYPKKAVKKGDTWKRTEKAPIGSGQTLTFEKEYKYVGPKEIDGRTYDEISSKATSVKLHVPDDIPGPLKVVSSELKVKSAKETLLYDRELRMITRETTKVNIVGDLKVSINGMELPGELDLTMESKSKTRIP